MQRNAQASFSRNRLLSTMYVGDFELLRPHLKRVVLQVKDVLEQPNEPFSGVYFLEPGLASVVARTASGERLEVGVFGPEGMSGIPILFGDDRSPLQTFIQVAGPALHVPVAGLIEALEASPTLRAFLCRYAHAYSVQVAYTALANGRYTLAERLSRWLLMCHDRLDGDTMILTHEFLSLMLGVRRAGITSAIHVLEAEHVIKATRGRIEILDRAELLLAAGESYGIPEAEYDRIMAH